MTVRMNRSSIILAAVAVKLTILAYLYKKAKDDKKKKVVITLPDWLMEYEASFEGKDFKTDEEMAAVAIEISALNTKHNSGGPFGTAIFMREKKEGGKTTLLSVGCNRVVPLGNSTLHGEMTAIQFAQKKLNSHSLRSTDTHEYILCTSCEPCCMCLGGVMWSGVSVMICSGTKDDAEAIGFNEGPVFPESYKALEDVGVHVKRNVSQPDAAAVLKRYGQEGVIY